MPVETKDGVTSGTERLNAVIAWWGLPSAAYPGAIEKSLKRWQALATELQTNLCRSLRSRDEIGRRARRPPWPIASGIHALSQPE